MLRVLSFLYAYFRYPLDSVVEEDIAIPLGTGRVAATLMRPRGRTGLPGWVVLHGITVPGRHHPVMRRFAHAFAATGAAILIPDVASWRELRLDLPAGDAAIIASVRHLSGRSDVTGPLTLVGFSFGATQALTGSTLPEVGGRIGSVIAFGGYYDFRATLRFMMTGSYEWKGGTRRVEPDPYGRWIAVANYLPHVERYAHLTGLVEAARKLAEESGRLGIFAGDPLYNPLKAELREGLTEEEREMWDLIAPPSGVTPPLEPGLELADLLAEAAARVNPAVDPRNALSRVTHRVVLAHGYDDQLIPFAQSVLLYEALGAASDRSLSITHLFAHSAEADRLHFWRYPRQIARYFSLLNRALPRRSLTRRQDSR